MKKVYLIDLIYYTDENVPECGGHIYVLSDQDLNLLPKETLLENPYVEQALEASGCESIMCSYDMTKEEFMEDYPGEDLINFDWEA